MDSARLDALVRAMGTASRRDGLRLLATAAMGGSLASFDLATTEAKKKRKNKNKKKCKRGKKKCGKKCIPATNCCTDADCGNAATCHDGTCVCPIECCSDADCPGGSGQVCLAGTCACPVGEEDSGGVCGTRPTCTAPTMGPHFCDVDADCCTGDCTEFLCRGCVVTGQPCYEDSNCCQTPAPLSCRGFVCTAD